MKNEQPNRGLIGESALMKEVFEILPEAAAAWATVFLQGESGTGKGLVARVIHQLSPRNRQPLVTVPCATLSAALLESELFGHVKGTLFFDDIGEIDTTLQTKLLKFLSERALPELRLIVATNKNLEEMVKAGTFREDLFYRLRVVEICLPPLRERAGDIPLLAQTFLCEFAMEQGKEIKDFTAEALDVLIHCAWPGNVRELRTAVEHAVSACRGHRITMRDLPPSTRQKVGATASGLN